MNAYFHVDVPYIVSSTNHPTSTKIDALNMHTSLHAFLKEYKQYKRALCRILLIDFHCLRYALPVECADMTAEAFWQEKSKVVNRRMLKCLKIINFL